MLLASATQLRVHTESSPVSLPATVDATSDHELMIAVRAGEIRRLGELFERHHRPLYGFFVRLTNQPAASEDLVQIVFYRILKYRHTYRDEGKFSAWIYHLARKVAADHFRKSASTPTPTDPVDFQDQPDQGASPDAKAVLADDVALMRRALTRVSNEHREVLVLSRLQHLNHQEIARLLDCSVGAVKVRAHRALKELREVYFKIRKEAAA
ncbi:MAG: RNA polymerase sigma factor [Lacunisphaera sp.]